MSKKILIFEDDAFLSDAYKLKLSTNKDWQSVVVANGEGALARVQQEKPDIIILDIVMPKVSGLDVLKQLKADASTQNIPVIIASNIGQKVTVDQAMKLGAADYFIKSEATIGDLLEKCRKYLQA